MKTMYTALRTAASVAALSVALCGCGSDSNEPDSARVDAAGLTAKNETKSQAAARYEAATVAFDGTPIHFTVYAPTIDARNSAPLVIMGPGWLTARTKDLDTRDVSTLDFAQQAARIALEEGPQGGPADTRGWYVISFDQRGFGESTGLAEVQNPKTEGKDVQAIINWAESNLNRLAYRKRADGSFDPVVGGLGGSYGGGFQTIGAAVDSRIDAVVPAVTWYDLRTTLFDKAKSMWTTSLFTEGAYPDMRQALLEGSTTGNVNARFLSEIHQHSPAAYCEGDAVGMSTPGIPAFFIQGAGDTLFNLTEGIRNYECFRRANPHSKFLSIRDWHNYDLFVSTAPKFTLQNDVNCNGAHLNIGRLEFSFLAQTLVDSRFDASHSSRYLTVPDVRATLDDGIALSATGLSARGGCYEVTSVPSTDRSEVFLRGGTTFTAPAGAVRAGLPPSLIGLIEGNPLALMASPQFAALFAVDVATQLDLVPSSNVARSIVGIPSVAFTLSADTATQNTPEAPIVFVGLVRIRPDGSKELIHDQVTTVEGIGRKQVELAGMSTLLLPDERINLAIYGFHPRYYQVYSRHSADVSVSDIQVQLPVFR